MGHHIAHAGRSRCCSWLFHYHHVIEAECSQGWCIPSLDDAIESTVANFEAYAPYYINLTEVEIIDKGLNSPGYPFIWALGVKVHADSFADGRPFRPGPDEGLTFFVHTKDGWIHYREDLWIDLEFLGFWMRVYQLYGTGARTS